MKRERGKRINNSSNNYVNPFGPFLKYYLIVLEKRSNFRGETSKTLLSLLF